jgi:hypothetical protein
MANYTGRCTEHGEFDDEMRMTEFAKNGLLCPTCGKHANVVIRNAPPTLGPLPSKRLDIGQIGQSFSSLSEERAYFKSHPDRVIVGKGDATFRAHRDLACEKANSAAKRMGFRDLEDRRAYTRKDNAQKKRIASGDVKIQTTTS